MDHASSDKINDALLLRQIAEGNVRAFKVLYEKYRESTYQNAFRGLKEEIVLE